MSIASGYLVSDESRGCALSARRRGAQPPFDRAAAGHGAGGRMRSASSSPAKKTSTAPPSGSAAATCRPRFRSCRYQGRTLRTVDITRHAARLLFHGWIRSDCMLQRYAAYQGARIQRIDHLNCFTPDVQASYDFYHRARLPPDRIHRDRRSAIGKLWAVWLHRKGNVHDLAFTNGRGPRLHHIGAVDGGRARHPAHLRRDGDLGLSRQHGARAGPARHFQRVLSLHPRSRRPPHRAVHQRTISPSIPTSRRCAGR